MTTEIPGKTPEKSKFSFRFSTASFAPLVTRVQQSAKNAWKSVAKTGDEDKKSEPVLFIQAVPAVPQPPVEIESEQPAVAESLADKISSSTVGKFFQGFRRKPEDEKVALVDEPEVVSTTSVADDLSEEYQDSDSPYLPIKITDHRSLPRRIADGVTNLVKSILPTSSDNAIPVEATDVPELPLERNSNEDSEDFIKRHINSIAGEILEVNATSVTAILDVCTYVDDVAARKFNRISEGIFTRKRNKEGLDFYLEAKDIQDENTKQRALQVAVEHASMRWWNIGFLKTILSIIPSYKAAYSQLVADTRDSFETWIASDEIQQDVNTGDRASFNRNFKRYQKYLNESVTYVNEHRFGYIFDKKEEMERLSLKMNDFEEVKRLSGVIQGLEKRLETELLEESRKDFEGQRRQLMEQRQGWVDKIWQEQQIKVPAMNSKYDPSKPVPAPALSPQEQLQQHYGDLADLDAQTNDVGAAVGLSNN